MAKIPALVSYFGGKNRFESFIKPNIPNDYKNYIEPFSGSFGVYFFLDIPEDSKVRYNDINRDQTNLVACSKNYDIFHDYLKNEIEDINGCLYCKETEPDLVKKHYKELYYSLKNSNFRNEDFNIPDMKRASQYAFLLTSAFSSCSYTAAGFSGFKLKTFLNKLKNIELQKKLKNIDTFETLDFEEFINKYDSEDTFIYLDPPYNTVEKKETYNSDQRSGWYGTKDQFGQAEHTKLLELLKTTKSRWALSYYYFDELEMMLPKDKYIWLEKDFFRSSASFSDTKETKGTELLIMNYKLTDEELEENKKFLNSENKAPKTNKKTSPKTNNTTEIKKIEILKDDVNETVNKTVNEPVKKDEEIDDFWNS